MAPGALHGIRVVEMSYAVSAPWTGRILASQGAELIKIESRKRPDLMRLGPFREGQPLGAGYPDYAAGKLHVTLDFHHPEARSLLDELLQVSDVMLENVSQGVVDRLHLDYASLSQRFPRLIVASLPAFGRTGPFRHFSAYGMSAQAYAGINAITGYPGEPPMNPGLSYPDYLGGIQGAIAIAAALIARGRDGKGRAVEVALTEAAISALGAAIVQQDVTGQPPERRGNGDAYGAPHGTYRAMGEDRWIAISCFTDAHWLGLCDAMDQSALGRDERFSTMLDRIARGLELDATISAWTRTQDVWSLAEVLQRHGVPAAPVQRGDDLPGDEHLLAREYFRTSDYAPYVPLPPYPTFPVPGRYEKTPEQFGTTGALGSDNARVFGGILGRSADELARLEREGVLS